jgi:hypothetical protein
MAACKAGMSGISRSTAIQYHWVYRCTCAIIIDSKVIG